MNVNTAPFNQAKVEELSETLAQIIRENNELKEVIGAVKGKSLLLEDETAISKLQTSLIFERNKREEVEKQVLKLQQEEVSQNG